MDDWGYQEKEYSYYWEMEDEYNSLKKRMRTLKLAMFISGVVFITAKIF